MASDSSMQPLGPGDRGPAVADVHAALRALTLLPAGGAAEEASLDQAVYDAATELAVRHFQQVRGLSVDGRVGEETYRALSEARWSLGDRLLHHDPVRPMRGDDVTNLQDRLHELGYDAGPVDGIFGPETESGLRAFQRDYGLTSDGTCGPATLRALRQLGRKVIGGRPQLLRQSASFVESGPHLIGRRIVVDPGHGGTDTGFTAGETTEADLVLDLGSHPKTWDLLRMSRMPAVRIDVGYLSHPVDRLLLLDARLRSTVASAVLAAVQRLFLPAEADPPTGTFILPAKR